MRAVRIIGDVETLKVMAEPTRAAILELLTEPLSVTELARALDMPRTRLYHHIELLRSRGLVEQVDERQAGAMTERIYALTAKTFRVSERLLRSGPTGERIAATTTLIFDTTKADLTRSLAAADESSLEPAGLGLGRSIAHLTEEDAKRLLAEVEALVARFDGAHSAASAGRPYALVWALYPSSRTIS